MLSGPKSSMTVVYRVKVSLQCHALISHWNLEPKSPVFFVSIPCLDLFFQKHFQGWSPLPLLEGGCRPQPCSLHQEGSRGGKRRGGGEVGDMELSLLAHWPGLIWQVCSLWCVENQRQMEICTPHLRSIQTERVGGGKRKRDDRAERLRCCGSCHSFDLWRGGRGTWDSPHSCQWGEALDRLEEPHHRVLLTQKLRLVLLLSQSIIIEKNWTIWRSVLI